MSETKGLLEFVFGWFNKRDPDAVAEAIAEYDCATMRRTIDRQTSIVNGAEAELRKVAAPLTEAERECVKALCPLLEAGDALYRAEKAEWMLREFARLYVSQSKPLSWETGEPHTEDDVLADLAADYEEAHDD